MGFTDGSNHNNSMELTRSWSLILKSVSEGPLSPPLHAVTIPEPCSAFRGLSLWEKVGMATQLFILLHGFDPSASFSSRSGSQRVRNCLRQLVEVHWFPSGMRLPEVRGPYHSEVGSREQRLSLDTNYSPGSDVKAGPLPEGFSNS